MCSWEMTVCSWAGGDGDVVWRVALYHGTLLHCTPPGGVVSSTNYC